MRPQSNIGHGAFGVRSNMRGMDELLEQSYCGKTAYVDLQVGKQIPIPWATAGSNVYSTPFAEYHPIDGQLLDVVGVQTEAGDTMTRRERQVQVQNNANSFWYDEDNLTLYVRLTDNVDPNTTTLMALLGLRFASSGQVEPSLGPDRFFAWGWSSPTLLTNYFEDNVAASGVVITQETTERPFDSIDDPAKIAPGASGLSAGTNGGIRAFSQTWSASTANHLSGWYRTSPDLPATGHAALIVDYSLAGGTRITSDGRSQEAGAVILLDATGGEWRRFLLAWLSHSVSGNVQISFVLHNSGGSALTTGHVHFGPPKAQRVWRYEYCEPRLDGASVPDMEIGSGDIYFGSEEVGLGSVKLLNQDETADDNGYLETLLGTYHVISRRAQFTHGGTFPDGQEVTFDDALAGFSGTVDRLDVDDLSASLAMQDTRALMSMELPLRIADRATFPGVSDLDVGRPRPIVFGTMLGMNPIRTGLHTNGLPVFEVVDGTDRAGDAMAVRAVYSYVDTEAAGRKDPLRRVTVPSSHWTETGAGALTLTEHPGPFEIVAGVNDMLDLAVDGNVRAITLDPGLYTAEQLYQELEGKLDALPDLDFTCGFNNSTLKFTIDYTGGVTLSLLLQTGANTNRSAYPTFGWDADADVTGALSYSSTTAVYDSTMVDRLVIRVDIDGMQDDGSGTHTGTAGSLIQKGPDILRYLLRAVLRVPATSIDTTTFLAGRTTTPQILAACIGGTAAVTGGGGFTLTLQEVVDRLEVSCHTDVVMDGQGKWYWNPRPTTNAAVTLAAATAPILTDRDFMAFRSGKGGEDVYSTVRLNYDQDPATGITKRAQAHLDTVTLFHGSQRVRVFDSFITNDADAGIQAWNLMLLAVLPRRMLEFTIKGRLLRKLIGELVRVRRTRMLPEELAGAGNSDVFRILRMRFSPQTHTTTVVAYTADQPRNEGAVEATILVRRATWTPMPWTAAVRRGIRLGGAGLR